MQHRERGRLIATIRPAVAILLSACLSGATGANSPRDAPARLQETWRVVAMKSSGEAIHDSMTSVPDRGRPVRCLPEKTLIPVACRSAAYHRRTALLVFRGALERRGPQADLPGRHGVPKAAEIPRWAEDLLRSSACPFA